MAAEVRLLFQLQSLIHSVSGVVPIHLDVQFAVPDKGITMSQLNHTPLGSCLSTATLLEQAGILHSGSLPSIPPAPGQMSPTPCMEFGDLRGISARAGFRRHLYPCTPAKGLSGACCQARRGN